MLAIWSLVPLPLLNLAWNVWKFSVHVRLKPSLRILSITLLAWERVIQVIKTFLYHSSFVAFIILANSFKSLLLLSGPYYFCALSCPFLNEMEKGKMYPTKRESYIQLNVEFPRIARRDKKAFLNKQCKENCHTLSHLIISGQVYFLPLPD